MTRPLGAAQKEFAVGDVYAEGTHTILVMRADTAVSPCNKSEWYKNGNGTVHTSAVATGSRAAAGKSAA